MTDNNITCGNLQFKSNCSKTILCYLKKYSNFKVVKVHPATLTYPYRYRMYVSGHKMVACVAICICIIRLVVLKGIRGH